MFKKIIAGLCLAVLSTPVFCGEAKVAAKPVKNKTIILATTTSVQDTGLLDVVIDAFQKDSGYTVKGGTGTPVRTLVNFVMARDKKK